MDCPPAREDCQKRPRLANSRAIHRPSLTGGQRHSTLDESSYYKPVRAPFFGVAMKNRHNSLPRARHRLRRLMHGLAALAASAAAVVVALVICLPSPVPKLEAMRTATTVLDRQGRVLRTFRGELDEQSIYVKLGDISAHAIDATLAVEDKRFHAHFGVDPIAVLRAVFLNVWCRRVVSGASTITMQLARLMEPKPRTLESKAIEAFRALQLEWALTKDQVLEYYLNFAPYGGNVVGIEAAARRYFGKGAGELTLAEAALLAGLPQAPSRLRPDRWPKRAQRRRNVVLHEMWEKGHISRQQFEGLIRTPVSITPRPLPFRAPHFARLVRARAGRYGALRTTLDGALQAIAEHELADGVARLRRQNVTNGSVVVIDNSSGAVAVMVGSMDFFADEDQGQVNGATAPRSPGSALKPFTYALAFERGVCTPDTVLADVPCQFDGYSPENFDQRFHGPVAAADALARSLNIPAVRLLHAAGAHRLEELLGQLGIDTSRQSGRPSGLALTLGACEVTLLDLTNAYACLARLGLYRPYALLEGETHEPTRRLSAAACYLVADALLRTRPAGSDGPAVALKTGTSYGHRDAWAVGYNPDWTIGVWLGNFSGRPAHPLIGISAAAPIVYRIFDRLYGRGASPWYAQPASVGERIVCTVSGMPAASECITTRAGRFIAGVSPTSCCSVHRPQMVDSATSFALCVRCAAGRSHHSEVIERWPRDLAAWLLARSRLQPPRPHLPGCPTSHNVAGPRIVSPQDGQCYAGAAFPGTLSSRLLLAATAPPACQRVCWFVNGEVHRWATPNKGLFWPLKPGRHTLTCVDTEGRGASVRITVR